MKGILIQDQLEFRLEVSKETINQGEEIPVRLSVKNHSSEDRLLDALEVKLAFCNLKDIKEKNFDNCQIIDTAILDQSVGIAPGKTKSYETQFMLEKNCLDFREVSKLIPPLWQHQNRA